MTRIHVLSSACSSCIAASILSDAQAAQMAALVGASHVHPGFIFCQTTSEVFALADISDSGERERKIALPAGIESSATSRTQWHEYFNTWARLKMQIPFLLVFFVERRMQTRASC